VWLVRGRRVGRLRRLAGLVGLVVAVGMVFAPSSPAAGVLAADPGGPGTQTSPPYGLDRLDSRDYRGSGTFSWQTTARNVTVYVIGDLVLPHATFGGRSSQGADFTGGSTCPNPFDNFGTGPASLAGGARHGVAKEVRMVGVRVAACSARTTAAQLVAGMDWVTANAVKPAVALLPITHPADASVDAAARRLIGSGVTLVTTAGDSTIADSRNVSPARVDEAIAVGRLHESTIGNIILRNSGSSTGPNIDLFAMDATMAIGSDDAEYAFFTLASPGFVAGAAALVLSVHPDWTPVQVSQALVNSAIPNLISSVPPNTPNRALYVGP
jgi:hypothetical protein